MQNGNLGKQKERAQDRSPARQQGPPPQGPAREDPLWVPYSPPPQDGRERMAAAAQNYGFTAAIVVALAGLLGALLWFSPEMGETGGQEAAAQNTMRTAPPAAPAGANPYTGEATLSVTSSPAGATVFLGGDTLGVTPLTNRPVPAGVHLVTVAGGHDGGTVDSVLVVRSDRPNVLRVTLASALPGTAGPDAAAGEAPAEATAEAAPPAAPAREEPDPAAEAEREAEREAAAAEARRTANARSYARAMQEGNDRLIEGDYTEARHAYEAALAIRPGDEKAADRLRRTDSLLAERAEAQAQYQYYRARGDVLFEQERFQEATAAYRQALDYRPGDAYAQGRITRSKAEARAALDEAAKSVDVAGPDERRPQREEPPAARDLPAREAAPARLNLNTATAAQLERLPGIGPKLSQRIVEEREARGSFRSARDVTRVYGIGPKTFEAIQNLVFVEDE